MASKPPIAPDPPDLPLEPHEARSRTLVDHLVLEGAVLRRIDWAAKTAGDIRLVQCRLDEVDMSGTGAPRATFEDVAITGGSLANARLSGVRVRRATFQGVRMTGADLSSGSVHDTTFNDCRIDLGSFRFASLERVTFEGCRLEEIDFYGADLRSVSFLGCAMVKAVWGEATLTRCEMRGTDISAAGNPERLRGVRMPWPDVVNSAGVLAAAAGIEIID